MQAAADQVPAILWFRQDLRLADQAALMAAMDGGRPVLPVYILDDAAAAPWPMGGAGRWWLHHSLTALQAALAARGAPLVLRRGPSTAVLRTLLAETGAASIHAGRMHEPWARILDQQVDQALPGVLRLHRTSTLFDLDSIRTKTGGIYGVYTPFARGLRLRGEPPAPCPAPARIRAPAAPASDRLEDWGLLPRSPDWAAGLRATWTPGEAGAARRLDGFGAPFVDGYDAARNLPGRAGTSMLSPHLHWGEVSPGQVWHAAAAASRQRGEGLGTFVGELLWREFAAYLLHHNPHLPEQPLRPRFAAMAWRNAAAERDAWQRGQTGVPIVDAGMRQLWRTGWMHNRVRMIVASYLTKHLLLPWQDGEAWFWDTLVDADLASNAASWQWVAGCGIDAQPYFRVFNPVSQGEKFDPDGAYVRAWAPELARLPDRWIHAPWTAPPEVLSHARVVLGRGPGATYPAPLVDLAKGRERALAAYKAMNGGVADHEAAA